MNRTNLRTIVFVSFLSVMMLSLCNLSISAQDTSQTDRDKDKTTTGTDRDRTTTSTDRDRTTTGTDRDRSTTGTDRTGTYETDQNRTASGGTGKLSGMLVDRENKARKGEATVQVTTSGIKIVDPASAHEQPKSGQGHFHYKLDNGPVIATTATKLSFHELTPGQHTITVMLAANDHSPLGPEVTLNITVPPGASSTRSSSTGTSPSGTTTSPSGTNPSGTNTPESNK
jgi:hypothetical protein